MNEILITGTQPIGSAKESKKMDTATKVTYKYGDFHVQYVPDKGYTWYQEETGLRSSRFWMFVYQAVADAKTAIQKDMGVTE